MYGQVEYVEQLTPHLVRVVFGGPGLAEFVPSAFTDAYVNAHFPPPGAPYGVPFDDAEVRVLPAGQRPAPRRYTVRRWAEDERLLSIDFVVHGDTGVAGPWARRARPGDRLQMRGPAGAYRPDPVADWHLLVGDESALPAVAAALEQVPAGRPVLAVLEVDAPGDEVDLVSPGDLETTFVYRSATPGRDGVLAAAVEKLNFPAGTVHAFVHGEAVATRAIRTHLLAERGVDRATLSVSPYWRRGDTDEQWRTVKASWQREVEQDVPAA